MNIKSKFYPVSWRRKLFLYVFFFFLVGGSIIWCIYISDSVPIWLFIMWGMPLLIMDIRMSEIHLIEDGIVLIRRLSKTKVSFYYDELDGYKEGKITQNYVGKYDVIYLIKDGKIVHKIHSHFFMNFDELKSNLPLKYLGKQKTTFWEFMEEILPNF